MRNQQHQGSKMSNDNTKKTVSKRASPRGNRRRPCFVQEKRGESSDSDDEFAPATRREWRLEMDDHEYRKLSEPAVSLQASGQARWRAAEKRRRRRYQRKRSNKSSGSGEDDSDELRRRRTKRPNR